MRLALALVLLVLGRPAVAADDKPAPKEMTAKQLVEATRNAIVRINPIITGDLEVKDKSGKAVTLEGATWVEGGGTGFIVPGGFIVTNDHVIQPDPVGTEIQPGVKIKKITSVAYRATFAFDTRHPLNAMAERDPLLGPGKNPFALDAKPIAPGPFDVNRNVLPVKVVGRDALADLAVLEVVVPPSSNVLHNGLRDKHIREKMDKAAVAFAPAGNYAVGDDVVAIGFPVFAEGPPTVTKGIISALHRPHPKKGAPFSDLIQTDAAINPGNSGGPLFDMSGRIVGVNTYSLNHISDPGVGFARSSRTAEPFVKLLVENKEIRRPELGFDFAGQGAERTDTLGLARGLLVTRLVKDGPAEKAGLRPGDIVVQLGAERVTHPGDFHNALAFAAGKDSVAVTVWRLPEEDAKAVLAWTREDIQRFEFRKIFDQTESAIKLKDIQKVEFTLKLK